MQVKNKIKCFQTFCQFLYPCKWLAFLSIAVFCLNTLCLQADKVSRITLYAERTGKMLVTIYPTQAFLGDFEVSDFRNEM